MSSALTSGGLVGKQQHDDRHAAARPCGAHRSMCNINLIYCYNLVFAITFNAICYFRSISAARREFTTQPAMSQFGARARSFRF
jgi:hypothetical protein